MVTTHRLLEGHVRSDPMEARRFLPEMTLSPITRAIALALAACAALFVLTSPALAISVEPIDDQITTTKITSPGDPFFAIEDESLYDVVDRGGAEAGDPNTVTVTGTADGDEWVDLYCFYSRPLADGRTAEWVDTVDSEDFTQVGDDQWTFEKTVDLDDFYAEEDIAQTCTLRAVPNGDNGVDLAPFAGPRVGIGYWDARQDRRLRSARSAKRAATRGYGSPVEYQNDADFYGEFPQLQGAFAYDSIGSGGVVTAMPFAPGTFASMGDSAWDFGSGLLGVDLFGSASSALVDGQNAFNAYDAPSGFYAMAGITRGGPIGPIPTFPEIDGQPELKATIQSFDSKTGAVVIREEQNLVRCDTPEGVEADFFDLDLEACPELVETGVKLVRTITQQRDGRASVVQDDFTSTDGKPHNVDLEYGQASPDEGRTAWRVPGAADYTEYGEYDEVALPSAQVGSFFQKNVDDGGGFFCPICFKRAADGASDYATGSVTYAQKPDRAVFGVPFAFVLDYNRNVPATGKTTLTHAYGTGRTQGEAEAVGADMEKAFTPAAASAPSHAAAPGSTPQEAPAAPVFKRKTTPVKFRSLSSRLKGRKFTVTIACADSAQGGTIKVRTRSGKRFTLGTRAYQCPAGGQRTVTFTVTRSQLRKLRRLGRRVRVSTYTVARDADGKPVSIGQIITLATK
jgi:hypothetical protein